MVSARFLLFVLCLYLVQSLAISRSVRAATSAVHVTLFTSTGVTAATLVPAILNTRRIFARAGIVVTFADPHAASSASDPSRTALRVFLVDEGAAPRTVLGAADITTGTAWVFIRNVRVAVRASGAHEDVILGHAMAHELGHLLIGLRDHRVSGLMAEILSFTQAEQGVLGFLPEDAMRMRDRLADGVVAPR
jgi:hypothetical protein